jgi:hypothetical protein
MNISDNENAHFASLYPRLSASSLPRLALRTVVRVARCTAIWGGAVSE